MQGTDRTLAQPSYPAVRKLTARAIEALVALALGAAYARTLAPGITWANDGSDSGDLVTAAATLGVAHPTGYPTYLLLARAFQLLPIGDLAYRTTLLSAAAALLAALCAGRLARELIGVPGWLAQASAGVAALALGFAPVFWSQAVIAEVYALNALFVALILWFAFRAMTGPSGASDGWAARGQALLVGLALGNHVTVALAASVWFAVAVARSPRAGRARLVLGRALWVGLGLLVYLYLPLRAAAHPPVNWGDPRGPSEFWAVVSGQLYRGLAFGVPASELPNRLRAWAGLLVMQFGPAGLALGFLGLLSATPRSRLFIWLSAALALAYSVFAITYNTSDSYPYLIPAFLIFAIWIGLGLNQALAVAGRLLHPLARPAILAALVALFAWRAAAAAPHVDASQDRRAIDFAAGVLAAAPPGAIVVANSDLDAFPLWYGHYALGQRRDLVVLVDPLLEFGWYRENLRFVYPALELPATTETSWMQAIAAANPQLAICHTPDPETDMAPLRLACDR